MIPNSRLRFAFRPCAACSMGLAMSKRPRRNLRADPARDPASAWPYPESSAYFMSGSNDPTEIEHAAAGFRNVGVAAPEVRDRTEAALRRLRDPMAQEFQAEFRKPGHPRGGVGVFVDSGAFSEVAFHP